MLLPIRRPIPCQPSPAGIVAGLAVAALTVALSACGARPPELEPPALRIVELELDADESVRISLRVRNPVAATLPAARLGFTVSLDQREVGRFDPPFDLDVPALGNELIEVETRASPEVAGLLRRLEAGELARVPYLIDGGLTTRDDKSRLEFENRGWLSPTPGKPGSFR